MAPTVLHALPLDVPTLFIAIVLVSTTLTLMVAVVSEPGQRDGLLLWGAGLLAQTGAYALFALRGRIDDVLSIWLANVLLSLSFVMETEAVCQFRGRGPPRAWLWPPVALTALVFAAFIHTPQPRLVVGPVIFSAQIVSLLVLLWRGAGAPEGRGAVLVGLGMVAALGVLALRAAVTLVGEADLSRFSDAGTVQVLSFLVVLVSTLVATFGFTLMNKERADRQSRLLAMYDELTGLPNRRQSLLALARQAAAARRAGQPLAVLMLDIDHFKHVNDLHGHLVGDAALRHVAQTIASRLRQQDTPGRFGGEEFLCVLPATSAAGALQLAEAVRAAVAQQPFVSESGQALPLTVSVGVAELPPGAARGAQALISAADAALYRVKAAGRNAVLLAREDDYSATPAAGHGDD